MSDVPPFEPMPPGVTEEDWAAACAAVRNYCGWHVAPSITETIIMDGPGERILPLPTLHLTAVESITIDGRAVTEPKWSQDGTVVGWWGCAPRSIMAEITHGYDVVPADLLRAVQTVAQRGVANPLGAVRVAAGPFNLGFTDGGSGGGSEFGKTTEQSAIDRYKLPSLP